MNIDDHTCTTFLFLNVKKSKQKSRKSQEVLGFTYFSSWKEHAILCSLVIFSHDFVLFYSSLTTSSLGLLCSSKTLFENHFHSVSFKSQIFIKLGPNIFWPILKVFLVILIICHAQLSLCFEMYNYVAIACLVVI